MRDAGYSVGVTADDAGMLPSYDELIGDDEVIEVGDLRLRTVLTRATPPAASASGWRGSRSCSAATPCSPEDQGRPSSRAATFPPSSRRSKTACSPPVGTRHARAPPDTATTRRSGPSHPTSRSGSTAVLTPPQDVGLVPCRPGPGAAIRQRENQPASAHVIRATRVSDASGCANAPVWRAVGTAATTARWCGGVGAGAGNRSRSTGEVATATDVEHLHDGPHRQADRRGDCREHGDVDGSTRQLDQVGRRPGRTTGGRNGSGRR